MTSTCKNCGNKLGGNFCSHCGQASDTHDISLHFLWHDLQHGFLHVDHGIFYTIQQLFIRPGYTIREFIKGKRIKHFKPISFVIILSGLYSLLYHLLGINPVPVLPSDMANSAALNHFHEWMSSHFALIEIIHLPIFSLASFLVFRKHQYNYAEHFVLNAYLFGQKMLINLFLLPLMYAFNGTATMLTITTIGAILGVSVIVWGYSQFFDQNSKMRSFNLTMLTHALDSFGFMLAAVFGAIIYLKF